MTNLEVEVRQHQSFNQSLGTVYTEEMSNSTNDELLKALSDQHAMKINRMKRKVNGKLESIHRYIITFNKPDHPKTIEITSWHFEPIEPYLPKPMRCLTCQRIGHSKKHCRREETTCSQCGEDGHISRQCTTTPPRCLNCGGEHDSMSNKGPHYLYKSEVLAAKTVNKIPFNEAADFVQDGYLEEGKPYSFYFRRKPKSTRNFRTQKVQPRRPSSEEILSSTFQNTNSITEQTQNQREKNRPSHHSAGRHWFQSPK